MARGVRGEQAVARKMRKLARQIPIATAAALYQEALVITAVSMRRTPVDVTTKRGGGTLRDSHETSAPRWRGKVLQVDIKVGGPTAPYAAIVHERVLAPSGARVRHPVGQAKFLESAINDAIPTLRAKIADRIRVNRLG